MSRSTLFIVAVTGCPTGIAHTFMAEAALKKAAIAANIDIRVETNGASGIENALTADEIARADAVIVAADKAIEMDRFAGKPLLQVPVGQAVKKAPQLIQAVLQGEAAIYSPKTANEEHNNSTHETSDKSESASRIIYKCLMSGVSNMLPFVVAGGVLIAVSFFWGIYSFDPNSEQYNRFAAQLFNLGKLSFSMMVPIFTAFIAHSISGRPGFVAGMVAGLVASQEGAGFLGGIVAGFFAGYFMHYIMQLLRNLPRSLEGFKSIFFLPLVGVFVCGWLMLLLGGPIASVNNSLMGWLSGLQGANPIILGIVIGCMSAFDLGGPVNKAAYVTGTMLLADQGNINFMAGVMTASMVPPLVTAFATVMFRHAFDKDERTAGAVNFILSATFIAEGAIPFAAKDPLRVLPILMLSSSIGASLTYLFNVGVPAPHGGLIILPLVTNALLWIISIVIGGLVGGVIFGMYRQRQYKKSQLQPSLA